MSTDVACRRRMYVGAHPLIIAKGRMKGAIDPAAGRPNAVANKFVDPYRVASVKAQTRKQQGKR